MFIKVLNLGLEKRNRNWKKRRFTIFFLVKNISKGKELFKNRCGICLCDYKLSLFSFM